MIYHTSTTTKNIDVQEPPRPHNVGADFAVPFLQALGLGILFAGAMLLGGTEARDACAAGAIIAALAFTLLLVLQQLAHPGHRRHAESHHQVIPITRTVGERRPTPGVVLMDAARNHPPAQTQAQADTADAERLIHFVLGCERNGTSSHYWESRIARPDFIRMRAELIRAGYARWRGATPREGWYLTRPAAEIVAAIRKPEAKTP